MHLAKQHSVKQLAAKHLVAILICTLLCLPAVPAQTIQQQPQTAASSDVTIIIQQDKVRFTAQKAVAEMRLQVFNQAGESVFDSGLLETAEASWPLKATNGETLKSGLYAYTLSVKEVGSETTRLRRGHFIVDRAKDRDGTDKLWVTSQNESGVGTELTVAKDEAATVAGAAISNGSNGGSERTIGQRTEIADRDAAGRTVEPATKSAAKEGKAEAATAPAATVGQIAKFTTATVVGDSVMTELNGNIGIGTTSPTSKLEIAGQDGLKINGFQPFLTLVDSNAGNARGAIQQVGGGLNLFTNSYLTGANLQAYFRLDNSGNVGLGLATPLSKFHVLSGPSQSPPRLESSGTTSFAAGWDFYHGTTGKGFVGVPGTTAGIAPGEMILFGGQGTQTSLWANTFRALTVLTNGNVGIGTANPGTKLQVEGVGPVVTTIKSGNDRAVLALTNSLNPQGYTWTLESGVGGQFPSLFGIYNVNANKIGLTIDGNMLVSVKALQITGGSDFAENFDVGAASVTAIQPGMVVAIDPVNPGKLSLSHRAYDHRVAGIISGAGNVETGMRMGQAGTLADGKHPVALSGRVYVWADATRGAIRPGDLLTTSTTPGHAMKVGNSAKAQGAIIGKAMTGLKTGKGLVLVLVTLQ